MSYKKHYYNKSHEIIPEKKPEFYSVFHVTFAAAIGSVLAGAVLVFLNFKAVKHPKKGTYILILCFVLDIIFLSLGKTNTDKSLFTLYMIPHGGCMYFLYQFFIRTLYFENINRTVSRATYKIPLYVGLMGFLANLFIYLIIPESLCKYIILLLSRIL